MEDFLLRGLLGGMGVAVVTGPIGCFIVWRKMAYFGDSLAHAALLGMALGFSFGTDLRLGILVACVSLALFLLLLQTRKKLSTDTLLGVLSHAALAFGVIGVSLMEMLRVDLMGYLFGDILAVGPADLLWIYGGGATGLCALALIWRGLLAVTVSEELARAEGVPVFAVKLAFMLLIALVVAVGMKLIGILLITSMLIIPAATARPFSRTPERMAALASLAGACAVALGMWVSVRWNAPAGPSVVAAAALLFFLSFAWSAAARGKP